MSMITTPTETPPTPAPAPPSFPAASKAAAPVSCDTRAGRQDRQGRQGRQGKWQDSREAVRAAGMRQTEFEFPPALAVPRRVLPARAATGVLSDRSRRRPAAPQSTRLEICPEAFAEGGERERGPFRGPFRGEGLAQSGAFEAVFVLLATIVFGLGWAAFELGRGDLAESGYDRAAAGAWELAAARPEATGPAASGARGHETRGDDPWVEGARTDSAARRSSR